MVVSSGRVRGSGSGKGSGADSSGRYSGNGNGDGIDSSHGSSRNEQLICFLYLREVYYSLPRPSGEASKGVALESKISAGF